MSGYRALDLTALCTTPGTVFPDPATVPRGDVAFHGLPFRVGAGDGPVASYLCLGRAHRPAVDVPVGGRPTWLVFAHALLDSELFEGGEVGRTCAEYTLRYADGGTRRVPVRERFEIAVSPQDRPDRPIPLDWGQTPFLALPDLEPTPPHRTVGRFDATGGRFKDVDDPSTRVPYRLPHRFFLWPLANPRADVDLVAVELRSLGPALVVAGITVGELDEEPFGRTVFQDVLLTLPPGERDIETLTVAVERGSASFPYWTVADPADLPAPPSVPGWGQDAVPRGPRRAHVRIAATRRRGSPCVTATPRSPRRGGASCWTAARRRRTG